LPDATHSDLDADRLGLADRLKRATHRLHVEAERAGFIGAVLRQRATRAGYVLFMRNLLEVYDALEQALRQQHEAKGPVRTLSRPELFRASAIRADLTEMCGQNWGQAVPVLASGRAYAGRVAEAAQHGDGLTLAGHAYTRYLGDLNGGQVLARLLARGLALPPAALRFYEFPQVATPRDAAAHYRAAIDDLGRTPGADLAAIEAEAKASFQCAITLANEVAALA